MDRPRTFARLKSFSYRLEWMERFVCITSGLSLSLAIVIAGGSTIFLGRPIPFLGLLQVLWVLLTVVAIDTQLWAAIGASRDALLKHRNMGAAAAWFVVIAFLLPPAFLVNAVFGLATAGIVHSEAAAVHILGISPVVWILQRCAYGVCLMVISGYTRPITEEKLATDPIVPASSRTASKKRRIPRKASTSVQGRPKRKEVAMTLWREDLSARLYTQNNQLSARGLAAQLTYIDPDSGKSYPCSTETAARILRPLRAAAKASKVLPLAETPAVETVETVEGQAA